MRWRSGAVALLEFFVAATWAGIIATYVLERVAHWLLRFVIAMWAMHVAVVMGMIVVVMIVIAIGTVHVGLLVHGATPE